MYYMYIPTIYMLRILNPKSKSFLMLIQFFNHHLTGGNTSYMEAVRMKPIDSLKEGPQTLAK